jgi:hypothetical protein
VLKSFRDRACDFPVYDRNSGVDAYLHTLGPLETPKQGSRAGTAMADPRTALAKDSYGAFTEPMAPIFKGRTGTD